MVAFQLFCFGSTRCPCSRTKKNMIFPLWRSQIIIFFKVRNCVRVFFCQYCSQAYLVKLLSGLGLFYSPYTVVQAQHGE